MFSFTDEQQTYYLNLWPRFTKKYGHVKVNDRALAIILHIHVMQKIVMVAVST